MAAITTASEAPGALRDIATAGVALFGPETSDAQSSSQQGMTAPIDSATFARVS